MTAAKLHLVMTAARHCHLAKAFTAEPLKRHTRLAAGHEYG